MSANFCSLSKLFINSSKEPKIPAKLSSSFSNASSKAEANLSAAF
jgi:hypothetical protein